MDNVRILVVEDKSIVARDIATSLEDLGYEVLGIVDNGKEAISKTLMLRPDLLLLDINIKGEMDGVEVASKINDQFSVPIIYLTAYSDTATLDRAKQTNPYAYIVKPFDDKDLRIAIDLAVHNFSFQHVSNLEEKPTAIIKNYLIKDSLFIKKDRRYYKVPVGSILYVQANGSYIDIHLEDLKYTLAVNLQHFERSIESPNFIRVHRSFIINLDKIDSFEAARLFIGEKAIPVSKMYREIVMDKFQQI